MWAKRHRDLGRARTQVACRLHAVLCDLVPGGVPKEITAAQAARVLDAGRAVRGRRGSPPRARRRVPRRPAPHRRPDARDQEEAGRGGPGLGHHPHRDLRRRPGHRRHRHRRRPPTSPASPAGTASPPTTAPRPIEVSSGNRKDLPAVPAREPAPQPRHPHGRRHPDPLPPQRRPRLLRPQDRRGQDPQRSAPRPQAARSATPSTPACRPTPAGPQHRRDRAREGNRGTTLSPARPAHTPNTGSSAKPLPDPPPPYDPGTDPHDTPSGTQPRRKTGNS